MNMDITFLRYGFLCFLALCRRMAINETETAAATIMTADDMLTVGDQNWGTAGDPIFLVMMTQATHFRFINSD